MGKRKKSASQKTGRTGDEVAADSLAARIRKLRTGHGLGQKEVADHIGVTMPEVSRWENGKRPSVTNLRKLARLFNVTVPFLTTGDTQTADILSEVSDGRTIAELLMRAGVTRDSVFARLGLEDHVVAVQEIAAICSLRGEQGLSPDKIKCSVIDTIPRLPPYVLKRRRETPVPEHNSRLMFLDQWKGALIDDGGIFTLRLSPLDWHGFLALLDCSEQLSSDIILGELDWTQFPGHISTVAVVETADNQLLLCRRGQNVKHEAGEWSVGIAETMLEADLHPEWGLHPLVTVLRGVSEELGVKPTLVKQANVRFLHMGLSFRTWDNILFCHVRVDATLNRLKQLLVSQAEDTEHTIPTAHGLEFSLENAVSLITAGTYRNKPVTTWSKMGLLYAAIRQFGTESVMDALQKKAPPKGR